MAQKLVSIREYARMRGVSHTTVNNRVKSGKIKLIKGKIDPAKADADWDQNRDALQQLRGGKPGRSNETGNDGKSLSEAQRLREWIRVKKEKLLVEKLEGSLVDAAEVEAHTEARFREEAKALLEWPATVSADIAAELAIEERTIHAVLDKYIRMFLRERSSVPVPGGASAA